MGKVVLDKTMSLDGFIAGPNDDVTRLFAWYGDRPGDTVAHATEIFGDPLKTTGAVVMGRRSFDMIDSPMGWMTPDGTSLPWPIFVLTHESKEKVVKGANTFTFIRPREDAPPCGRSWLSFSAFIRLSAWYPLLWRDVYEGQVGKDYP